jgi:DNA-binding SARP family transcriptional activator
VEIELLGSLTLAHAGRKFGVGSRKVRTVLALLALSPGSVLSFDQLADELWVDQSMSNARNALQANIARLRKLIESVTGLPGEEIVRTVSSGYQLDISSEAVDVQRFLLLARQGGRLVDRTPHEAIGHLEEALRLWRGTALSDVLDGPRCRLEAVHLNERRLTVQEDLISARLAVGEERGVVLELEQLVAEHPGRERLSEYLMLALYRTGRQTEAVDVFHRTRKWLGAELGLEPGRALRQLYQDILVQDSLLD